MKRLLLVTIMIFNFHICESQTYEAQYLFEINTDHFKKAIKKNIKEGKDPNTVKQVFSKYLNSRPVKARLIFNEERSYYHVNKDMGIDEEPRFLDPIVLIAGNRTQYYQQQNQDSVMTHIKSSLLETSEFLVNSYLKPVNLKNETKTIGKYKCFVAELQFSDKQTLHLWYSPDIPVHFNIIDFAGLPGLLIKIESNLFDVNLTSLRQIEESELKQPPGDIPRLTLKEYQEMSDKTNPFKTDY